MPPPPPPLLPPLQASPKSSKEGGGGQDGKVGRLHPVLSAARGMVSPVLLESFTLTFLAEWGDRSQIATIGARAACRADRQGRLARRCAVPLATPPAALLPLPLLAPRSRVSQLASPLPLLPVPQPPPRRCSPPLQDWLLQRTSLV